MPGNPPVNLRYDPVDGGMLSHMTNQTVELVVLPWRYEDLKVSSIGLSGAAAQPPETATSTYADTDIWAGGYDLPLRVIVNANAIPPVTPANLYGCEVASDFMGSVFGVVQSWSGNYPTGSYMFSYPFTAVIDGVAYPVDPRQPWLDFPALASPNGTGYQRATIIASGLHPGRHHLDLQFAQAADGVTNRDWLFPGRILARNAFNVPPPPVEIVQNAVAVAVGTDPAASVPQIAIRGLGTPGALGITRITVTNPNVSATTFFYRPYIKNGPGASAAYISRIVPAGDSIDIVASGGRFWPQDIQCYGSATGLTARVYYQR